MLLSESHAWYEIVGKPGRAAAVSCLRARLAVFDFFSLSRRTPFWREHVAVACNLLKRERMRKKKGAYT